MTELLGRAAAEGARNERVRDRRTRFQEPHAGAARAGPGPHVTEPLPAEAQPSDRDPGLRRQCYASSRGTSRSGRRRRPASRTRASGRGAARGRPRSGGSGRGGRRGRRGQLRDGRVGRRRRRALCSPLCQSGCDSVDEAVVAAEQLAEGEGPGSGGRPCRDPRGKPNGQGLVADERCVRRSARGRAGPRRERGGHGRPGPAWSWPHGRRSRRRAPPWSCTAGDGAGGPGGPGEPRGRMM